MLRNSQRVSLGLGLIFGANVVGSYQKKNENKESRRGVEDRNTWVETVGRKNGDKTRRGREYGKRGRNIDKINQVTIHDN